MADETGPANPTDLNALEDALLTPLLHKAQKLQRAVRFEELEAYLKPVMAEGHPERLIFAAAVTATLLWCHGEGPPPWEVERDFIDLPKEPPHG